MTVRRHPLEMLDQQTVTKGENGDDRISEEVHCTDSQSRVCEGCGIDFELAVTQRDEVITCCYS